MSEDDLYRIYSELSDLNGNIEKLNELLLKIYNEFEQWFAKEYHRRRNKEEDDERK